MTALDFAPLLAPGLPPPAAKFNGFPKYNFTGGHNDGEQIPLEAIVKAANDVLTREGRTLATYGLEAARKATAGCANFWRKSSSAPPASPAMPTRS